MAKKYGVALVGCGTMGTAHLDDIYCKDNVTLKYVCDLNEETAKKTARRYNAENWTTDISDILNDESVDIVIIATYPSTHLSLTKMCIEHKKHVICEKPMAATMEEADEFVKLIKEHPEQKVLFGYILRHNDTYNKVAEMIRGGAIGSPIVMRMTQNHHTINWTKYKNLINDTSPIIDCGVHYVDIMQWFTGAKITEITGIGQKTEDDIPAGKYNYGHITLKLSDGSCAFYESAWGNTFASENIKEFVGPKGRITISNEVTRISNREEGDLIEYYRYPDKVYESININCKRKPTGAQLDHLIKMIEEGVAAKPTIEEVYESFKIVNEADKIIRGEI